MSNNGRLRAYDDDDDDEDVIEVISYLVSM